MELGEWEEEKKAPHRYICYVRGCVNGPKSFYLNNSEKSRPLEENEEDGGIQEEATTTGKGNKMLPHIYFKFSKKASDKVRKAWLRNIPRRDDQPEFNMGRHVICNLHFDEEEVIRGEWLRINGEDVLVPRRNARLKLGAIPTKFPDGVVKSGVVLEEEEEGEGDEEETVQGPLCEPEDYLFEDPMFTQEYYCVFCVKSWTSRVMSGVYLEKGWRKLGMFLRLLARYGGERWSGRDIATVLEASSVGERDDVPVNRKIVRLEKVSTCRACLEMMEGALGTLEEMEVLRMKASAHALELVGKIKEGVEEVRKEERKLGKELLSGEVERIRRVHQAVRKSGNKLIVPKVVLTPLNPKLVADKLNLREDDADNQVTPENLAPTSITTAPPVMMAVVPPTTEAHPPARPVHLPPTTQVFHGGAQIRGLLWPGRERHPDTYHSRLDVAEDSNQDDDHDDMIGVDDDGGASCITLSAPPSPMSIDDGGHFDNDDIISLGGSDREEPEHEPTILAPVTATTPRLVLNDSLVSDDVDDATGQPEVTTLTTLLKDSSSSQGEKGKLPVGRHPRRNSPKKKRAPRKGPKWGARVPNIVPPLNTNDTLLPFSQAGGDLDDNMTPFPNQVQIRKTIGSGPDPEVVSKTPANAEATAPEVEDIPDAAPPASSEPPPSAAMEVEEKADVEEAPLSSDGPKKVPFMSAEYIGKYKVVCKLMNLKTGKTCLGIVAKPTPSSSSISTSTTPQVVVPKVISTEPVKKKKPKKIPGPPFICPIKDCSLSYPSLNKCRSHYSGHKKRLARIQRDIEAGIRDESGKKIRKPKEPEPEIIIPKKRKKVQGMFTDFVCEVEDCNHGFKYKESLDYHVKIFHSEIQCHLCSEKMPSLRKLIKHELGHNPSPPQVTTSSSEVTDEVSPQEPEMITCTRCDFTCPSRPFHKFFDHFKNAHIQSILATDFTKRRNYLQCEHCERKFMNSEKFRRHNLVFHGKTVEFPYQCSECPKRFLVEAGLKIHKKTHHSTNPPKSQRRQVLTCNICSTVYTRRLHYDNHMKQHASNAIDLNGRRLLKTDHSKFPFSCEQCGRRFPLEGCLWNHQMEVHSGGSYSGGDRNRDGVEKRTTPKVFQVRPCSECGKVCKTQSALYVHLRSHNVITPWARKQSARTGICDLCGKHFGNLGWLRIHIKKVHETPGGEDVTKEAICELCGKKFPSEMYLNRHMPRMHPPDANGVPMIVRPKPACKICGKGYANWGLVRKHVKEKHPEQGEASSSSSFNVHDAAAAGDSNTSTSASLDQQDWMNL